jgi:hypothetical protein
VISFKIGEKNVLTLPSTLSNSHLQSETCPLSCLISHSWHFRKFLTKEILGISDKEHEINERNRKMNRIFKQFLKTACIIFKTFFKRDL